MTMVDDDVLVEVELVVATVEVVETTVVVVTVVDVVVVPGSVVVVGGGMVVVVVVQPGMRACVQPSGTEHASTVQGSKSSQKGARQVASQQASG